MVECTNAKHVEKGVQDGYVVLSALRRSLVTSDLQGQGCVARKKRHGDAFAEGIRNGI